MERRLIFPFTAIVGQEKAKLALLCCAVDPTIGGVLLSGEKGTGKSTLVRALSQVLPEIEVVEGCPFGCNPRNPFEMCDSCYAGLRESNELKIGKRKMRVVDLPLSVTVDRLVGTLDIKRAVTEGVRALQPGLLAEANRNILYIDEVNLLDDYVADVLLDAAAMGWNIIEREGISVKHPARFILVGSMNPEEGELRPQILDRFGLYVSIKAVEDPSERAEVVHRVEKFHKDPEAFYRQYDEQERALQDSINRARELIHNVVIDEDLLKLLIDTIIKLDVRTHRAEITTVKTAKAIAALDGRTKVRLEDLNKAMELALPHRLKSKPLEPPKLPEVPTIPQSSGVGDANTPRDENQVQQSGRDVPSASGGKPDDKAPGNAKMFFEASDVDIRPGGKEGEVSRASAPSMRRGARDLRLTDIGCVHGHPITYTLPSKSDQLRDIDVVATLNAAAARGARIPLQVEDEDFRVRVRKRRAPRLSVIALDSSGSMGFLRRMSIAKGVAKELVTKSYVKRDSIALVVFRGERAEVAVPPTRRYEKVLEALGALPTGGRTPLPSALQQLLFLAKNFKMKNKEGVVKGIIITDGKGNVPTSSSVEEDVRTLASAVKKSGIDLEIHDTRPRVSLMLAPSYVELLAELTGAQVFRYN